MTSSKPKPSVSYLCDHCGKRIAVTSKDAAVMTTKGIYHSNRCLQEAYVAAEEKRSSIRDEKRERRSQAAKARWAKRRGSDPAVTPTS